MIETSTIEISVVDETINAMVLANHVSSTCETVEAVVLENVEIEGSCEDFAELSSALHRCPMLRVYCMCEFVITNTDAAAAKIDDIVKGLASLANLEILKIDPREGESALKLKAMNLSPLCSAARLQELHLPRLPLSTMHFDLISWAMCKTPLKVLNVAQTGMDDKAAIKIASALQNSMCELQLLDISFNGLTDVGVKALANALGDNTCLQVLRLAGCQSVGLEGLKTLVAMLETNKTLKCVEIPPSLPDTEDDEDVGSVVSGADGRLRVSRYLKFLRVPGVKALAIGSAAFSTITHLVEAGIELGSEAPTKTLSVLKGGSTKTLSVLKVAPTKTLSAFRRLSMNRDGESLKIARAAMAA